MKKLHKLAHGLSKILARAFLNFRQYQYNCFCGLIVGRF